MGYIKEPLERRDSTEAQRKKIISLCVDLGFIQKGIKANLQYTNEEFRPLFRLVFTDIPTEPGAWPPLHQWVDSLSMTQARAVINCLIHKHPTLKKSHAGFYNGW